MYSQTCHDEESDSDTFPRNLPIQQPNPALHSKSWQLPSIPMQKIKRFLKTNPCSSLLLVVFGILFIYFLTFTVWMSFSTYNAFPVVQNPPKLHQPPAERTTSDETTPQLPDPVDPRPPVQVKTIADDTPRHHRFQPHLLVVSRHHGAATDTTEMAKLLGFRTQRIDVGPWTPFGRQHTAEHKKFWESGVIEAMCDEYDVIAVTDNIWDSIMFVHFPQCAPKLLLIATNRYDLYLTSAQAREWHNKLQQALDKNDFKYPVITANNPYEEIYIRRHGLTLPGDMFGDSPPFIPVIRSLGLSQVALDMTEPFVPNPPLCLWYQHYSDPMRVYDTARQNGLDLECKIMKLPYGGPSAVRREHAPFIFMPYQVSVMKMWETLRAGCIFMTPSISFLESITHIDTKFFRHTIDAFHELEQTTKSKDPNDWKPYVDFYTSTFEPCFVEFNSWQELSQILRTKSWAHKEAECARYAALFPDSQLVLWHRLFQERFPHIDLLPLTPHQEEAARIILDSS